MDGENTRVSQADVLTLGQMGSTLSADLSRIESAQSDHAAASGTYAQRTRDGLYLTAEEQQAARVKYLPDLESKETALAGAARAAEANARIILQQAVSDRLVADQATQSAASAQQPLVVHLVDHSPLPSLLSDLRSALSVEDKPRLFLLAQLLPTRLAAEIASPTRTVNGKVQHTDPDVIAAISALLIRAREPFRDTAFDPVRKKASEALEKAQKAQAAVNQRHRERTPVTTFDGQVKVPFPTAAR